LLHSPGDQQNDVSFFGEVVWKFLIFVVGHQLPHILAFKEEVVVLAQGHQKISDVFPFVPAKFDAIEVRPAYFEPASNKVHYLLGLEVQKLQLIKTFLDLAVPNLRETALCVHFYPVLVLWIVVRDLEVFSFSYEGNIGMATPLSAPIDRPIVDHPKDHSLFYLVAGGTLLVVIFEGLVHDLVYLLEIGINRGN
jgi:hypothetical protein